MTAVLGGPTAIRSRVVRRVPAATVDRVSNGWPAPPPITALRPVCQPPPGGGALPLQPPPRVGALPDGRRSTGRRSARSSAPTTRPAGSAAGPARLRLTRRGRVVLGLAAMAAVLIGGVAHGLLAPADGATSPPMSGAESRIAPGVPLGTAAAAFGQSTIDSRQREAAAIQAAH